MPAPVELVVQAREVGPAWPLPVYSESHVFEGPLTLDTAAYVAGDTLADLVKIQLPEHWTVAILQNVYVLDEDDQGQGFDLLFFDAGPVISAKNAVWNTSDADMRSCKGFARVAAGDYVDLGGNRVADIANLSRLLPLPASRMLWVATISQGTGTYTAAGLRIKLGFLR